MIAIQYDPVVVARQFLYVREAQTLGQNKGARVEAIQRWGLGQPGQSWCGYFAIGFVLDICFQGDGPFPRTQEINGATDASLAYARKQGWVVSFERAEPGDLVYSVSPVDPSNAHHVAILVSKEPFETIAGNTDDDGKSSNGDRVAEHGVSVANKVFVQYPRTPTPGVP